MGSRSARALLILAALTLGIATAAPGAGAAGNRYLHAHIDAYSETHNCGGAEWSKPLGNCTGYGVDSPNAGSLKQWVGVEWCEGASLAHFCLEGAHAGLALPPGYTRWMRVCRLSGSTPWLGNDSLCADYLLGAVKMPNGPFAVVAGHFEGKSVKPSNPSAAVESLGGPLFLWVGFHGDIRVGNGTSKGYVFGLRGHLEYH